MKHIITKLHCYIHHQATQSRSVFFTSGDMKFSLKKGAFVEVQQSLRGIMGFSSNCLGSISLILKHG